MTNTLDHWKNLAGLSGCSDSLGEKKRMAYRKGGSPRSRHAEGEQPKALFGKTMGRIGARDAKDKSERKSHSLLGAIKASKKSSEQKVMPREEHSLGDMVGKMKKAAEESTKKTKGSASDAFSKVRNFLHFEEGGNVSPSTDKPSPKAKSGNKGMFGNIPNPRKMARDLAAKTFGLEKIKKKNPAPTKLAPGGVGKIRKDQYK